MATIDDLRKSFRALTSERQWESMQDPKSLLLALVGRVGAVTSLFQWVPADGAIEQGSTSPLRESTANELADVLVYLVAFADKLGIDVVAEAVAKVEAARPGAADGGA